MLFLQHPHDVGSKFAMWHSQFDEMVSTQAEKVEESSLKPDWRLLASHMYTNWPGTYAYAEINDRLFVNPGRNDNIQDRPVKGKWCSPAYLCNIFIYQWKKEMEDERWSLSIEGSREA